MIQGFKFFAVALVAIVAIIWLENKSNVNQPKWSIGFGAGILPPWLMTSASGSGPVAAGGPTQTNYGTLVATPDMRFYQ